MSPGLPIGEGQATADAPPALSSRAQGRAITTSPVGGSDRCDPNSPGADTELCRRRIETRADQYAQPGPAPLTPEARLLILTDPQTQSQSLDVAARRLGGKQGVDALAGAAASQLSGALDAARSPTAPTSPVSGGAVPSSSLPGGVPVTVVISPH